MPDLLEQRAERIGITFLRSKTINPFPAATAEAPPIIQALFAITRPPEKQRKKRLREIVAEEAAKPHEPAERIELPKGMVPYKHELYGPRDLN
jgi:hypothetical protein